MCDIIYNSKRFAKIKDNIANIATNLLYRRKSKSCNKIRMQKSFVYYISKDSTMRAVFCCRCAIIFQISTHPRT